MLHGPCISVTSIGKDRLGYVLVINNPVVGAVNGVDFDSLERLSNASRIFGKGQ